MRNQCEPKGAFRLAIFRMPLPAAQGRGFEIERRNLQEAHEEAQVRAALERGGTILSIGGGNGNFGQRVRVSKHTFAGNFVKKVAWVVSCVLPADGSPGAGRDAFVSIVFPQAESRLDRGARFRRRRLFRLAREQPLPPRRA